MVWCWLSALTKIISCGSVLHILYHRYPVIVGYLYIGLPVTLPPPPHPDFESETLSPLFPLFTTHLIIRAVFPADLSPRVTTLMIPPSSIVLDASWERSEEGEESGDVYSENISAEIWGGWGGMGRKEGGRREVIQLWMRESKVGLRSVFG
jgi:hypothetical protein